MSVKVKKINKSVGNVLKTTKNLQLLTGGVQNKAGKKLALENDVCCGLGRKTIYFSKGNGTPTKITKYPFTFNGQTIFTKTEFEQALTEYFGVGYIAYVNTVGNAVILSSSYKKKADGTLDIADYVVIS